jgi:NADH-quinone oxidoreductase subunit M
MLCFIIWTPIIVAFLLLVTRVRESNLAKWIALLPMLAVLAASIYVFAQASLRPSEFSFITKQAWEPSLGISYHLGVNRLSAMLILLTSLVGTAAIGVSNVNKHGNSFYALGLIMIGGLAGAFASLDLFFLYIFHEFALIPTFILIGIWGAKKKSQAAMKITLYLGFGSLILLLGFIGLYSAAGGKTFDLIELKQLLAATPLALDLQIKLFALLFLGFGILVSVFPFHTWAPMGYGEAPSLAAMLHAGVIKKFGLYGIMVIAAPLLPEGFAYWKTTIVWLAVGNLVYCGYVAMQQKDARYLLAYASISHMGYAFLAFAANTPLANAGLSLFLFAHGLSAAAGFAIVGYCREQTGTSLLSEMGGLARRLPFAATVFSMAALAGCGLPGFANFPAELMIFFGSFRSYPLATILGIWTVVISTVYLLRAIRTAFFGPLPSKWEAVADMGFSRKAAVLLLVIFLLIAGFWPRLIIGAQPANGVENLAAIDFSP